MDVCELPEKWLEKAQNDLGETPGVRRVALEELRERIESLPIADQLEDLSGNNLIRFLRSRKYAMDKALKATVDVRRFAAKNPQLVETLQPFEEELLNSFVEFPEQRGKNGEIIVVICPKQALPLMTETFLKANPLSVLRCKIKLLDALSRSKEAQIHGAIFCENFAGLTVSDMYTLSKADSLADTCTFVKYASILGCRMSGAYFFHEPTVMKCMWAVAQAFLSTKMRKRVKFCGSNFEPLNEVVSDRAALPLSLGGRAEDRRALTEGLELGM